MSAFGKGGKSFGRKQEEVKTVNPEAQAPADEKPVLDEVATAEAAEFGRQADEAQAAEKAADTPASEALVAEAPQAQVQAEQVATPEATPAPTAAPKEIKVGAVVGKNEAKLGKEASHEHKKAISVESTSKAVDTSTEFQQRIAKIFAGDNKRERYVATFMEDYLKAMSPGVGVSIEDGVRMQMMLWRTMKNVVENDEGFKEAFRLLIAYFKEYKDKAFHASYIHRFHPDLTMSPGDIEGLTRMANLLTVAAGVKNKGEVRKFVNISASFDSGLTDAARNRVTNYFDN